MEWKTCDRCGKPIQKQKRKRIIKDVVIYRFGFYMDDGYYAWDICPDCSDSLNEWFNNGSEKTLSDKKQKE